MYRMEKQFWGKEINKQQKEQRDRKREEDRPRQYRRRRRTGNMRRAGLDSLEGGKGQELGGEGCT